MPRLQLVARNCNWSVSSCNWVGSDSNCVSSCNWVGSDCNWFASSCNLSIELQLVQWRSCNRHGLCICCLECTSVALQLIRCPRYNWSISAVTIGLCGTATVLVPCQFTGASAESRYSPPFPNLMVWLERGGCENSVLGIPDGVCGWERRGPWTAMDDDFGSYGELCT